MSAATALQAALVVRLKEVAGLGVFDAPPVRGGVPHAVVEEPMLSQFDAAGVAGRIGTFAVTFRDGGERPVRLRQLIGEADEAVASMPAALAGGWRIAGLRLARSRLVATKSDTWLGMSEFAVRLYRLAG